MHIDLKSALLGAIVSAIVAPILVAEYEKRRADSSWAGEWKAMTCWPDGGTYHYDIEFEQLGNKVVGQYRGTQGTSAQGMMSGTVSVREFSGTWHRLSGNGAGGELKLALVNDSEFKGTLTNEVVEPSRKGVWVAAKDGNPLECPD